MCCAKSPQPCPNLCDPMDRNASSVHGILQARRLELLPCPPPGGLPIVGTELVSLMSLALAGEFFTTSATGKWKWKLLSCVGLFATSWTTQSTESSRPECWSGCPFPSAGDLPNLGIEPRSPTLQADSLPAEPPGKPSNLYLPPRSPLWLWKQLPKSGMPNLIYENPDFPL